MKLSTVAEMRAMDRAAIEQYGIPETLLMENAGLAAYRVLAHHGPVAGRRFVICCGGGNNGGDGLVIARHIHAAGGLVELLLLTDPARFTGASQTNFEIVQRLKLPLHLIMTADEATEKINGCDVIVDALLGTGITRPVEGLFAAVIELINQCGKPVLSVDIPSGIHGDTGQIMGAAVQATWTATFGLPKLGNLLFPGYAQGGLLYLSHISFPPALYAADTLQNALNPIPELPPRNPDGHKGTFGQTLFISGAAGYFGAPIFSAFSFLKAGGGYSRLATPRSLMPTLAARAPELVYLPQAETDRGSLALDALQPLLETSKRMDFIVLGPGISLHDQTQQLVRRLVAEIDKPLLLDGDGLTALQNDLDLLRNRRAPTILTPHLGEMARLTALTPRQIEADRISVLRRTAADLNAIIVLKGGHTQIGYPDGRIFVNSSGNSGMATAGSGDVLTGAIAAMHGLALPVEEAVRAGVFVHGLAGDLAADAIGPDGLTAQILLDYLPNALYHLRIGLDPAARLRYAIAIPVDTLDNSTPTAPR